MIPSGVFHEIFLSETPEYYFMKTPNKIPWTCMQTSTTKHKVQHHQGLFCKAAKAKP